MALDLVLNFNYFLIFILIIINSCGVKSPPTPKNKTLPSIDKLYLEKINKNFEKKVKKEEKK